MFVDENGVVAVDVRVQGFSKTYTQVQVDHMEAFTKKMWKFGITRRRLDNVAKELKASINRKKEKLCAERLTNGFDSTAYSHVGSAQTTTISTAGGDGVGAFDTTHTSESGGSDQKNVLFDGTTYNLSAGYAALKAFDRTFSLMVDPRGNPYPGSLTHVVVKKGGSASHTFKEILGAIKRGRIPESFDSDAAAVGSFEIIELDYLTNGSHFFGFDSSRALTDKEGFQFVESEAGTLLPVYTVYKTSEIQAKIESMFDLGHNDVTRSWVGSEGDESTPS